MILVTKIPSGLLIQKDDLELIVDDRAIDASLGVIIGELIQASKAMAAARLSGYETGLSVGYANGQRETEARIRKEAEQFAEALALLHVNAPLVA